MIAAGAVLLVLGVLWEVGIYVRGACPTALTWVLMILGLGMVVAGTGRRRPEARIVAWSLFAVLVCALVVLWLSG